MMHCYLCTSGVDLDIFSEGDVRRMAALLVRGLHEQHESDTDLHSFDPPGLDLIERAARVVEEACTACGRCATCAAAATLRERADEIQQARRAETKAYRLDYAVEYMVTSFCTRHARLGAAMQDEHQIRLATQLAPAAASLQYPVRPVMLGSFGEPNSVVTPRSS